MHSSKLGFQTWAIAIYLLTTSLKSVSSMKLHRDLGVTQKTAWHLAHRIREAWQEGPDNPFHGPVEVDETCIGGRRRNMHNSVRRKLQGRGATHMTPVLGVRDRETRQVAATVVPNTTREVLTGYIMDHVEPDAMIYSDDASAYRALRNHETVRRSRSEYVRGDVHTQGVESFWSTLKRAHKGVFHKLSVKHLDRYVREFAGRNNIRDLDTMQQMTLIVRRMDGSRLRYKDLIQ